MGHKEDREMLRNAGITEAQMNRLSKLRRNLAEEGKNQDTNRLSPPAICSLVGYYRQIV